jgi:mannose-P-dolichol utilization defect 1
MKLLLDIPIVMSLATWVWGNEAIVTPAFCVENLFHFDIDCWTRLIAKGLGIGIILGSCLNKTPVIYNLYCAKSTSGISLNSVYGESLVYTNAAFYGMLSGYPFTAYGENLALFTQSFVIINLMWAYASPPFSYTKRGMALMIFILYGAFLFTTLPQTYYYLLMTSIMPVLIYSRGSQILETYRCQHTGAQSVVTNTVNFLGVMVRILTTIKEVGYDIAMLGSIAVNCTLNLIILLQYFYYRKNTQQFLGDLQSTTKLK